jgi:hypothetical protein
MSAGRRFGEVLDVVATDVVAALEQRRESGTNIGLALPARGLQRALPRTRGISVGRRGSLSDSDCREQYAEHRSGVITPYLGCYFLAPRGVEYLAVRPGA